MQSAINWKVDGDGFVVEIENKLYEQIVGDIPWFALLLDSFGVDLHVEIPKILRWLTEITMAETDIGSLTFSPIQLAYALFLLAATDMVRIVRVLSLSLPGKATAEGSVVLTRVR